PGARRRARVASRFGAREGCGSHAFACSTSLVTGYATSPNAFRRRTVLCQNGGPLLGERVGASSGSSVDARNLRMVVASVTIARSFMRPLQLGHSSTSTANVLRRSSAHGRYVHPRRAGWGVVSAAVASTLASTTGL